MKKKSREYLEEYFVSNIFDKNTIKKIFDVFKFYSFLEIDCSEDIEDAVQEFCAFWQDNLHLIVCKDEETKDRLEWILDDCKLIKNLSKTSFEVQEFAEIVKTLFPQKADGRLLDVGAGSVPMSSILLGKEIKKVDSMDEHFLFTKETLQKFNVCGISQLFGEKTSVYDYDMVVGRFPCSAIVHIVSQCVKANKPYFIELCDCNLPQGEIKQAGWWGWVDVLQKFDERIQFYSGYAYNIKTSSEQVEKAIDRCKPKKLFDSRDIMRQARKNSSFMGWSVVTPNGEWKRVKDEREY